MTKCVRKDQQAAVAWLLVKQVYSVIMKVIRLTWDRLGSHKLPAYKCYLPLDLGKGSGSGIGLEFRVGSEIISILEVTSWEVSH